MLKDDCGNQFKVSAKRLGQGTFAEVFLGDWLDPPEKVGQRVAIKKFKNSMSKKTMAMLNAEIEIMRALDHPNIVRMVSFIKTAEEPSKCEDESAEPELFVVLEYCGGGDFKRFIKGKRMAEKHACGYMKQLAEGLKYLHSKNIIHRDLKPHNILLSSDGKTLKIADFGFARVVETQTLAATMCGSPLYMAPEVIRGERYTANADLWSVGVILYEMLCGERPFNDTSMASLTRTLTQEPIKYKREVKDSISSDCKALLVGLLQKDPSRRIDFDAFFDHKWFKIDWTLPRPPLTSSSQSELPPARLTQSVFAIPRTAPVKIPTTTTSAKPKPQRAVIGGYTVVGDYNSRLSSAPARIGVSVNAVSPPPPKDGSIFLSTTPQGQSEGSQSMSRSRSGLFSDVMTTGFGLLRDSFQNNGF